MGKMMSTGELVLGLAAWALGLAALFVFRRKDAVRICGMGSWICCAASLCVVVFHLAYMADIGDTAAFLDTANAYRLASGTLLVGTLALNGGALLRRRIL